MDPNLAAYLVRYYGRFMNKQEQLAHRHLMANGGASLVSLNQQALSSALYTKRSSLDLYIQTYQARTEPSAALRNHYFH
jgi:hypothetical protein